MPSPNNSHPPPPLPSILALSLHTVSVSFLVVFRNLIALFVAAFEYFVQVNASFPRPAMTQLCAHRIPCLPHCVSRLRQPPLMRAQGQSISMGRLGGLLAMVQVSLASFALCLVVPPTAPLVTLGAGCQPVRCW